MKILQVIPYFTPKRGGDVNVVYNLSKQLLKRGHDVTIITTDFEFDEKYARSIEKEGVKIIAFHCIINVGLFLFSPAIKKWLKANIKNFDIVHMHNFRSYQNNVVYNIANRHRIPYILQAHGSVLPFYVKQRLKKLYDWIWGYNILNEASRVIALSKTESNQYELMGVNNGKIELIFNGINFSEYKNLPKRGEFRKKFSIKEDEKIILYLGRLHKIKGIDLLVNVFANMIKDIKDIKLVIVGPDDGFLYKIERQIADLNLGDKVILIGPLYKKEKLNAYVDADVYVLPSVYEVFSLTVIEACACGIPVIITDQCGISDFVDNKVGYVVKRNVNNLENAIRKILSDEKLREMFGGEGKKMINKYFTMEKVAGRIDQLYEKVLKEYK